MAVSPEAKRLLDFIGDIEAPQGYGTVYGNKQATLPKPLTSMMVGEIIVAGPSWTKRFGSSACGRYQFMRATLQELMKEGAVDETTKLTPAVQDALGLVLLRRRGFDAFLAGKLSVQGFALNLAKEWASLPVLAATKGDKRQVKRGQSYYAGDGLNKSLVKPEAVEMVLQGIASAGAVAPSPAPKPATRGWAEDSLTRYEVEAIQKRLRDLGYFMVGKVDGVWGPSTAAALTALQAQAGVAVDGHWGPQTRDALADDKNRRKVSAARQKTTATDLRAQGSATVIQSDRITWTSIVGLLVGLGGAAYSAWQAPADLPMGSSILLAFLPPAVAAIVQAVGPWLMAFLPLAYNILSARGIIAASVEAERSGLHNGEPDPAPSPPVKYPADGPSLPWPFSAILPARASA